MRICVNDWCHSCIGQLHKSHWTPPCRQSFTREVAASYLVSPSRLQVARQSYILEVSHIHLCDWRHSLGRGISFTLAVQHQHPYWYAWKQWLIIVHVIVVMFPQWRCCRSSLADVTSQFGTTGKQITVYSNCYMCCVDSVIPQVAVY